MKVVIIAYIENLAHAHRLQSLAQGLTSQNATLICADSGGEAALAWNLRPDWLVGDMDSLRPASLELLRNLPGVQTEISPAEKDETDLELALETALSMGATDVTILGGLGGRLDHTLGNLGLLAWERLAKISVRLMGEHETVWLLRSGQSLELQGEPDGVVSLIPMGGTASGITTEGLYYRLRGEPLYLGPSRGVSNKFVDTTARVSLRDGLLLVVQTL